MKNTHRISLILLASIVGLFCLHLGFRLTASSTSGGLPVPVVGKSYTVQQLLTLINKDNGANTSNFIVPIDQNGNPVMHASCWQMNTVKGAQAIGNLAGSKSVAMAGLIGIINANLNTSVTLNADASLITSLYNTSCLNSTTQSQYAKILLYFVLEGYRFYINDPYPGQIVVGRVNPAASIIGKWNLNQTYNP